MLNPEQLAEIQKRADAAAEGPWRVNGGSNVEGRPGVLIFLTQRYRSPEQRENAEFAAAARTDIPALLAHIKELEKTAAKATRAYEDYDKRAREGTLRGDLDRLKFETALGWFEEVIGEDRLAALVALDRAGEEG